MRSCSAATGIPVPLMREAKTSGSCLAFVSGDRVALGPLLRWIFQRDGAEDAKNWGDEYAKWKAKREKIKHDEDAGEAVNKGEVIRAIGQATSVLFSAMDRRSQVESPAALKGRSESEIKDYMVKTDEALKVTVKKSLTALSKQPAPPPARGPGGEDA